VKRTEIEAAALLVGHRVGDQSERKIANGLSRAAALCGGDEVKALAALKLGRADAWRAFSAEVSINETYFFRHPEHFDLLNRLAADAYTRGRSWRTAWSIGCASGEEAWSLALTLERYCDDVKVAGTDLSAQAIEQGRTGRYRPRSFRDIGPENIPGIRQSDGVWEVEARLKAKVFFRESNLARDRVMPPPGMPPQLDVVFCRNVMVYLTADVIEKVLAGACAAVAEGGLLVLGSLEAPAAAPEGFVRVDDRIPSAFLRSPRKAAEAPRRAQGKPKGPTATDPRTLSEARALADGGELSAALHKAASTPPDADTLLLSASIQSERGDLTRAASLLRQALALRPDHIPALLSLVLVLVKVGDGQGVETHSRALAKLTHGRGDNEEVGFGGVKVAYVRRVLAGLS